MANFGQFHSGVFGVSGEEGFFGNFAGLFQEEESGR